MIIKETIYTCGNIGDIKILINLIKAGNCPLMYFVYKTNNPSFLYQIGTYKMLMLEKDTPVILGIAESKLGAKKIVCYLVKGSFF